MDGARKRLSQDAERVNPIEPVHVWRSPAGAAVDMVVVTHLDVYSTMHEHATAALPNETGGFLVGRVAYDGGARCWHLDIEHAVPVQPESQNPVHFTFTWRDVDRVRSFREEQNKALIGWYHTHPDLGIFLSETDLERTHRVLFSEPFQVALVYDPVRGRAGYFFWEGAQRIDASPASWREFDIAVALDDDDREEAAPAVEMAAVAPAGAGQDRIARKISPATNAPSFVAESPATQTLTLDHAPAPVERRLTMPSGSAGYIWIAVAAILFIVVGLAMGYFWFGPGRGLP